MEQQFIEIEQIQIILDTNISNNPEIPLTLSLLNTDTEYDSDQTYSQLPFFTSSCEFPIDLFMKMKYSQIIQFFFNKDTFLKTINKNMKKLNQTNEQKNKTIQNNVMVMLQYLLPTYPISNQLFSSYDMITSTNPKKTASFQNNLPQTMTIQDKKYNIKRVIWLNDLINHPKYAQFIDQFDKFMYWKNTTNHDIVQQLGQLNTNIIKTIEQQINLMFKIYIQVKPKSRYNATYDYTNKIAELNKIVENYKIDKEIPTDTDIVILPYDIDKSILFKIIESLFFLMKIPFNNNPIDGFTEDDNHNYNVNKTMIDTYYILTTILAKYFGKYVNFSFDNDDTIIKKYMKEYYGQYIDFKKQINEFVKPNLETTNPNLQTEIDQIINNQSNEFINNIQNIKRLRNNKKSEMINEKLKKIMYVGASVQTSNKKSEFQNIKNESPKYEIYVTIDLETIAKSKDDIDIVKNVINVKDTIQNQANKIKIKCNQQNDNLIRIFQSLREGKSLSNYNVKAKRKMLKVLEDSAQKKGGNITHRHKRISRNKTAKLLRWRSHLRSQ